MSEPTRPEDSTHDPNLNRLLELLSDRAVFGLEAGEEAELQRLQAMFPDVDDNEMDRLVALLETSAPNASERLPDAVKERILEASGASDTTVTAKQTKTTTNAKKQGDGVSRRDILISLASIAATGLIASFVVRKPSTSRKPLRVQRLELMQDAPDHVQVAWNPTNPATRYSGDVVWSNARQTGYMTFNGLPINDPTVEQYQLWIIDSTQEHPIDGGVFDITSPKLTVKIDPKLNVRNPTTFAITIEKPGGVVVSDQSRLPLSAEL